MTKQGNMLLFLSTETTEPSDTSPELSSMNAIFGKAPNRNLKSEKFFGALKVCPHQKLEIDAGANFNQSLRLDRRKVSLILRWKSVIL